VTREPVPNTEPWKPELTGSVMTGVAALLSPLRDWCLANDSGAQPRAAQGRPCAKRQRMRAVRETARVNVATASHAFLTNPNLQRTGSGFAADASDWLAILDAAQTSV
jgi:hypothetical protein